MITQLTPQQVQTLLQQRPDTLLLDVREEGETQICQIANSTHIPMNNTTALHLYFIGSS